MPAQRELRPRFPRRILRKRLSCLFFLLVALARDRKSRLQPARERERSEFVDEHLPLLGLSASLIYSLVLIYRADTHTLHLTLPAMSFSPDFTTSRTNHVSFHETIADSCSFRTFYRMRFDETPAFPAAIEGYEMSSGESADWKRLRFLIRIQIPMR